MIPILSSKRKKVDKTLFITTWKTDNTSAGSSNDNQAKLPLVSGGTYAFTVYWGDGSSSYITAYNQAEVTHTYGAIGTYTIKIKGTCTGWIFNGTGDKLKLLEIKQWGNYKKIPLGYSGVGNQSPDFSGCANLLISATDIPNFTGVQNFWSMFLNCSKITTVPNMDQWDMSSARTIRQMFQGCVLWNQNINTWGAKLGNLTDMYGVFNGATLFNNPLNLWGPYLGNLTTMGDIVHNCIYFNQDLSSFDVHNVSYMASNFSGATSFNQSLANWVVTSLTNATSFLLGVTLSTANYDALLIAWAALAVKSSVPFHAGNSKYTAGGSAETARNTLVTTYLWSITDGGTA